MTALRVAILDDDLYALNRLSGLLREAHCDVVKESDDSTKFIEWLKTKTNIDAIFIDIQMPKISGLDILTEVSRLIPVVFVTGHIEHAIKAFELSAYDFIMKPATRERLAITLDKIIIDKQLNTINNHTVKKISVKDIDNKIIFIPIDEITHFKLVGRRVYGYIQERHYCCTKFDTLSQIEEEFPNDFVRAHKDTLVRPESITSCQFKKGLTGLTKKLYVGIGDDVELEVSRNQAPILKERLGI